MYLILHKVRGEAAFDIAHQSKIGDEMGWIVSTSGHRAYPIRWWDLEDLLDTSDINNHGNHNRPIDYEAVPVEWEMLQDHYDVMPVAQKKGLDQLLKTIGMVKSPDQPAYNGVKMRRL